MLRIWNKNAMHTVRQEGKEELRECQANRSAAAWHWQSSTHSYELGWHGDRFLITEVGVSWTLRKLEDNIWTTIIPGACQEGETWKRCWLSHFLSRSEGNDFNYCHNGPDAPFCPSLTVLWKQRRKEGEERGSRGREGREGGRKEREGGKKDIYNEVKAKINKCNKYKGYFCIKWK